MRQQRSAVRLTFPGASLMTGGEASMLDRLAGYTDIDEPYVPVLVLSDHDYDLDIHFVLEGSRDELRGFARGLLQLLDDDAAWGAVAERGRSHKADYEDEDEDEDED